MEKKLSQPVTVEDIRSLASNDPQLSNLLSDELFQSADYVSVVRQQLQEQERLIRSYEQQLSGVRKRVRPLRNMYKLICWASEPSKTQKKKTSLPGPFFDVGIVASVCVLGVVHLMG